MRTNGTTYAASGSILNNMSSAREDWRGDMAVSGYAGGEEAPKSPRRPLESLIILDAETSFWLCRFCNR